MKIVQQRFMKTNISRDKKYSPQKLDSTHGNKIFPAKMRCKNSPCDPKIYLIAKRYSPRQKTFCSAQELFPVAKLFLATQNDILRRKIFPVAQKIFHVLYNVTPPPPPPPQGFRNTRIGSSSNIEILWKSYFPSKCVWKACFPILLGHGEVPASGFMPPHAGSPSHQKTKQNRTWGGGGGGGGQSSTWTKRGGICTDTWVCLHYWVVIWVAG